MFWRKTRDVVVETYTIVMGLKKDFADHVAEGETKYTNICKIIEDCHESCPETERFNSHTKDQNGTLKRMEKKYDVFFSEHSKVKDAVEAMKTAKKTKKEVFMELGKIVTIVCILLGAYFAYMRYSEAKKPDNTKIEKMFQELIDK